METSAWRAGTRKLFSDMVRGAVGQEYSQVSIRSTQVSYITCSVRTEYAIKKVMTAGPFIKYMFIEGVVKLY